jgi:Domain of unknown function (DUF4190)/GYF domain 2
MGTYIVIGSDGKEYGPIPADDVRQWIADGRINAQTKAQVAGTGEWKLLAEFPEFSDVRKSPLAPPSLPAATPAKTSGMAITSLVLAILGLFSCGITAVLGLIFGIIALIKVRNSGGRLNGFGFALTAIILSVIILLIMPAMLLPALARAKLKAQAITCLYNEKQLALAALIYADKHGNQLPQAATWCDDIKPFVTSEKVFKCPSTDANGRCDYAFNAKLDGLNESKVDRATVMIFESYGGWNANGGPELMIDKSRHGQIFMVAFADGSVQQLPESQLSTLRWDP